MAVLAATTTTGLRSSNTIPNILTSSDTFTYLPNTGQTLRLRNITAGILTVNLKGNAALAKTYPDGGTVNYSLGFGITSIPATTGDVIVVLDLIPLYLGGNTVTVTGGTGIEAVLLNP